MKDYETGTGKDKKKLADDYFDDDGEPKEDKIKLYLYEKETANSFSLKNVEQQKEDDDGGKGGGKMSLAKEWFGFGSIGKSLLVYVGGGLLITGIVAFIF